MSPRATPGIFIGLDYYDAHPLQQKGGYKILTDINNPKSIICSRDVIFIEDQFTIPVKNTKSSSHVEGETIRIHHGEDDSDDDPNDNCIVELPTSGENSGSGGNECIVELPISGESKPGEQPSEEHSSGEDNYEDARSGSEDDESDQQSVHKLRSGKVWKKAFLTFPGPPLKVALSDPEWIAAMEKENQQIKDMGVFELVEQPAGKQVLNSLWVLVTKVDDITGAETHKARWVVDGSKQIQGESYDKAFAATPSMASYKTLLAIRTQRNMKTLHIDWSGAHLNSIQDFEVYVQQPRGFEEPGKEYWVRKLIRACYGEKQAAYLWELCRDSFLIEGCGFERCPFDPCTFIKRSGTSFIVCDVHADDAPFMYDDNMEQEMEEVLNKLQKRFKIKIERRLSQHLGMRVEYGMDWTTLDQEAYCSNILQTFQENPQEEYSNAWPLEIDEEFDKEMEPSESDKLFMKTRDYWGLVGKLQYLVNTRPDIAYAVGKLARKCSKPRVVHWNAAQRLLGYLQATTDMKLVFRKQSQLEPKIVTNNELVQCYSDADFAGDKETRRSTSGLVILVCGAAVFASSKRQPVVADSTVAAETIALHSLIKETIWLKNFLEWLGYPQKLPTTLWCDNMGAVRNCEDGADRHKTKHLDIKYMFIREAVRNNLVKIKHIGTDQMIADILTKGLRRQRFEKCRKGLGLMKGSVWNELIKPKMSHNESG